jgi:hypothetical protein
MLKILSSSDRFRTELEELKRGICEVLLSTEYENAQKMWGERHIVRVRNGVHIENLMSI